MNLYLDFIISIINAFFYPRFKVFICYCKSTNVHITHWEHGDIHIKLNISLARLKDTLPKDNEFNGALNINLFIRMEYLRIHLLVLVLQFDLLKDYHLSFHYFHCKNVTKSAMQNILFLVSPSLFFQEFKYKFSIYHNFSLPLDKNLAQLSAMFYSMLLCRYRRQLSDGLLFIAIENTHTFLPATYFFKFWVFS